MVEVDRAPGIRPRPTLARRLDAAARGAVPFATTLALVLFAGAIAGLPGEEALRPALALCSVFAWTLLRPALLMPPLVFLIGLLCDLLGWLPLGVATVTLLAIQGAALRLRRTLAGAGLAPSWACFAVLAALAAGLLWALASALSFRLLPAAPALRTWGFAVVLYPSVALLALWLSRSAAAPERA
ncbi:MAG TPA: rod shape-determining protein MreD [Acetobacteraceae bacterium]|nr:rod shape-determining protein MreD [Acetobacteraceae bacterium]